VADTVDSIERFKSINEYRDSDIPHNPHPTCGPQADPAGKPARLGTCHQLTTITSSRFRARAITITDPDYHLRYVAPGGWYARHGVMHAMAKQQSALLIRKRCSGCPYHVLLA